MCARAAARSRLDLCTRCCGACTRRAACASCIDSARRSIACCRSARSKAFRDAAALLLEHRERGRILVIGDFDADGATSTALVVRALRAWGFASVDFLVPNRFEFGYGLTPEIVALAATRRPRSSSPWTTAFRARRASQRRASAGIDVLITDHHLPGSAAAAGERHRESESRREPFRQPGTGRRRRRVLRDGGVAAACSTRRGLLPAGRTERRGVPGSRRARHRGGRRAAGCEQSRAGRAGAAAHPRRPLRGGHSRAAARWPGAARDDLTAADLAFGVAPRLNAAGRIDDMSIGIQCLLADDAPAADRAGRAPRSAEPGAARDRSAHAGRSARGRARAARSAVPTRFNAAACASIDESGIRASSGSSRAA